jgi:ADP-heptose:LPS heptosyltransferase
MFRRIFSRIMQRPENAAREARGVRLYKSYLDLPPGRPPRILILKLDHIGDMLLGMRAFREIRNAWPGAGITLVCSPANASFAAKLEIADNIVACRFFEDRSHIQRPPNGVLLQRFRDLRLPAFDIAIDLRFGDETRFLLDHVEARFVCGFFTKNIDRKLDVSVRIENVPEQRIPSDPKNLHDETRLLLLARTVIEAFGHTRHPIHTIAADDTCVPFKDTAYAVLAPAAGAEIKQWPNESFAAAGRRLIGNGLSIVLVGDRTSQADCDAIARQIGSERVRDLSGKLPLEQLPDVLRHARLFIGNDSGPGHLAAALDVPAVIVFSGAVNIETWQPRGRNAVALRADIECSPCYLAKKADCRNERRCLTAISPEYVVDTALELSRNKAGTANGGLADAQLPGGTLHQPPAL